MKLTSFKFFKNTPLNDFINTIHFRNNNDRDNFFLYGGYYNTLDLNLQNYNFIRDRLQLRINCFNFNDFVGVNYCTFKSDFDGIRYYAYVLGTEYKNNGVIQCNLLIDVIMTFTQGKKLNALQNLLVTRQHLTESDYQTSLPLLQTNNDLLETTTKKYVFNDVFRMNSNFVIFSSAYDLTGDFGDKDDPNMLTSKGGYFDGLASPLDYYVCEPNSFTDLMEILYQYPWVAQNIKKVAVVPVDFLDFDLLEDVKVTPDEWSVKKFKHGEITEIKEIESLKYPIFKLMDLYGLSSKDKHMFRDGYFTLEMYSWDGQSVLLNPALLDENTGLELKAMPLYGVENEIRIFPVNYSTTDYEEDVKNVFKGTFLNNAFIFSEFTEMPILINNSLLSYAGTANQRELAESKLISNRVSNIKDGNASLEDRFFNSASVLSNISPRNIMGKITDEYEFYRTQKAEIADMSLQSPTLTNQTKGNAFNLSNDIQGITLKLSAPDKQEIDKIIRYYNMFGFQIDENGIQLSDVESMSICNYLQFKGNYVLPQVPVEYMEMMKPLFENGVRFWHNNNTANPMTQDITNNVRVR